MAKSTKDAVLTLRISEQEQEQLRRAAAIRNQSVSEYVRHVVKGDVAVIASSTTVSTDSLTRASVTAGRSSGWLNYGAGHVTNGNSVTVVASDR
jgi:hypothetical protein